MLNSVEEAIRAYTLDRSDRLLAELAQALVDGDFVVPVSADVQEISPGKYDVPVVCLRTGNSTVAIPAFTTIECLLHWDPAGSKYTALSGAALIAMADGMPEISEILVNPGGTPRGTIPREEFAGLLSLPKTHFGGARPYR